MAAAIKNLHTSAEVLVVALARSGDSQAFAELVRRKQAWLRNFMYHCCGSESLADDLSQQTLLNAWQAIRKLREPRRFNGWLRRIAVTTWMKHQRRQRPTDAVNDVDHPSSTPVVQDHTDIAMDLDTALNALSTNERLCVVLAHHEGMSHQEISRLIDMPLGTVKSHVRRGTQHLQTALMAYTNAAEKKSD